MGEKDLTLKPLFLKAKPLINSCHALTHPLRITHQLNENSGVIISWELGMTSTEWAGVLTTMEYWEKPDKVVPAYLPLCDLEI